LHLGRLYGRGLRDGDGRHRAARQVGLDALTCRARHLPGERTWRTIASSKEERCAG
jgi:hypothetical protein